jgi:nicotinamide-nucleotide amidase
MLAEQCAETAELIAARAMDLGITVGCAESITWGGIAACLGAATDSRRWFRGGIVAHSDDLKFQLLRVSSGPVVTAKCASEMATGATAVLRVHHAVAATGVSGPEPIEGHRPGTVFIGLAIGPRGTGTEFHFPGDPQAVAEAATLVALRLLLANLGGSQPEPNR